MAATREDITLWFNRGIEQVATHLIVVCDTFDYDDYPVFVKTDEDAKVKANDYMNRSMQKVMEVYNLSMPLIDQLNQHRAFNY